MSMEPFSAAKNVSYSDELDEDVEDEQTEEADEDDLHDPQSYYEARSGDFISFRYRIIKKLGQGQFSNVWMCRDLAENKVTAVKIVRSKSYYNDSAYHEIKMIQQIQNADSSDRRRERIVHLLDYFAIPARVGIKHICLVFETVGIDLWGFIRERYSHGAPIIQVKRIISQILEGTDYIHSKCGIIHTDLKPENIIIVFVDNDNHEKNTPSSEGALKVKQENCEEGKIGPDLPQVSQDANADISKEMLQENLSAKASGSDNTSGNVQSSSVDKEMEVVKDNKYPSTSQKLREDNQRPSTSKGIYQSPKSTEVSTNLFSDKMIKVKITDFGNSCTIQEHLAQSIQTRNYRSPEILIGAEYGTPVDIWSIGCITFELATGEVLFNPPSLYGYDKDEIHIALMMQILGDVPIEVRATGSLSPKYFLATGDLIHVDTSKRYTLAEKLIAHHKWTPQGAEQFSKFLKKMLDLAPMKRATAAECLHHPWLLI